MSELTSVQINALVDIDETIDGNEVIEDKSIDMTILLEEPYARHFAIEINSNMAEPIISEVYELEHSHYIHSTVQDVNWAVISNPMETQQLSPLIKNEKCCLIFGVYFANL